VYNSKRLVWQLDDESTMNPAGYCVVLQGGKRDFCRFNRLAAALAKSQDHRVSCGVFAFGPDRQGALADGLHGLNPRNTDNRTHPLHCRPALIERLVKDWVQRWNKAQSISESIRQAHLVLRLFFNLTWSINEAVKRWSGVESIHPWRTYA
jgi:hypothetical protein